MAIMEQRQNDSYLEGKPKKNKEHHLQGKQASYQRGHCFAQWEHCLFLLSQPIDLFVEWQNRKTHSEDSNKRRIMVRDEQELSQNWGAPKQSFLPDQ